MKSILILEMNPFHNETVPGIVYYFKRLDYETDVILREEMKEQNVFCRYSDAANVMFFDFETIIKFLRSDDVKKYDFLYLNSMEYSQGKELVRTLDVIGFIPAVRYGVLGMYHTNTLIDKFCDYDMMHERRLFCISEFQVGQYELTPVSPVVFCDTYAKGRLSGTKKKNLLIIGGTQSKGMLNEAYWKLTAGERKLLNIQYIGSTPGKGAIDIARRIYHYLRGIVKPSKRFAPITYLGKLNFSDMFHKIEECDYLLVLLDPDWEEYKRYRETSTSGCRQLILGFNKIGIIHSKLAELYDFTEDSYVGFTEDLSVALRRVIRMNSEEYASINSALSEVREYIIHQSSDNIKRILEYVMQQSSAD